MNPSEIEKHLEKIEQELINTYDPELVSALLVVMRTLVSESSNQEDLIKMFGDVDVLFERIKTEAFECSCLEIIDSYAEHLVKKALKAMVPSGLLIAASLIQFALM